MIYTLGFIKNVQKEALIMTKNYAGIVKEVLAISGFVGIAISFGIFSATVVDADDGFGGATISCADGSTHECYSGTGKCTGTDNVGCSCSDSQGKVIAGTPWSCPRHDDLLLD